MHDDGVKSNNKDGTLTEAEAARLGGYAHVLHGSSHKSRRISHSTSHAETLAMVASTSSAQLVALRLTELLAGPRLVEPRLQTLMDWQLRGKFVVPVHAYTDCKNLFELLIGQKGVPSDKSQRLAVLALREDRLCGRTRTIVHINTYAMLADCLTKTGWYEAMDLFLTSGYWHVFNLPSRPCTLRHGRTYMEVTEQEIIDIDESCSACLLFARVNANGYMH